MYQKKQKALPPKVIELRGYHVMLASSVAEVFQVETRQIVQNIKFNNKNTPPLFPERYAFQLTSSEYAYLRSLGMISKPGRGGSRKLPWAITRKGAIRLTTIMKSKRAIEAADIFIDIFDEVLVQLHKNKRVIELKRPSRLASTEEDVAEVTKLRRRIAKSINELLDTVVNPDTKSTVRDELQAVTTNAISYVKEFLRSPKVKNEHIGAKTILILEKARDIYERRQAELANARLDWEAKALNNVQKKIEISEKLWKMYQELEPSAVADLVREYGEASHTPKLIPNRQIQAQR